MRQDIKVRLSKSDFFNFLVFAKVNLLHFFPVSKWNWFQFCSFSPALLDSSLAGWQRLRVEHFSSQLQGEKHQIGCNPLGSRAAETKKRNIKLPKTFMPVQERPRKGRKMAKSGEYGKYTTNISLLISWTIDRVATTCHQGYVCVHQ